MRLTKSNSKSESLSSSSRDFFVDVLLLDRVRAVAPLITIRVGRQWMYAGDAFQISQCGALNLELARS